MPADIYTTPPSAVALMREQCNRYGVGGFCSTRACLMRGGYGGRGPVNYGLATCEHHEAVQAFEMAETMPSMIWAQAEAKLANFMTANSFATGHGENFDALLRELEWQIKELRARNQQ